MRQSPAYWRRECNLSIERSRARRAEPSPHPWPNTPREWVVSLLVAVAIVLVSYGFLVFFGAGAWS